MRVVWVNHLPSCRLLVMLEIIWGIGARGQFLINIAYFPTNIQESLNF